MLQTSGNTHHRNISVIGVIDYVWTNKYTTIHDFSRFNSFRTSPKHQYSNHMRFKVLLQSRLEKSKTKKIHDKVGFHCGPDGTIFCQTDGISCRLSIKKFDFHWSKLLLYQCSNVIMYSWNVIMKSRVVLKTVRCGTTT